MRPRTLYGRMLLVSAAATLVALVVAGLVIGAVLGRFVTEGLDRRLDAQVLLLASTVDAEGRVDRALLTERLAALDGGPGGAGGSRGRTGAWDRARSSRRSRPRLRHRQPDQRRDRHRRRCQAVPPGCARWRGRRSMPGRSRWPPGAAPSPSSPPPPAR
ncbi:hypothetical protein AB5I41_26760 [Sphingomonas sp. MMS24-JH45]